MRSILPSPRLLDSVQLIRIFWALFLAAGGLSGDAYFRIGLFPALAALGMAAWAFRARLYQTVTSASFGVGLLDALALATVLGTLVVQGSPSAFYTDRYGAQLGEAIWGKAAWGDYQ